MRGRLGPTVTMAVDSVPPFNKLGDRSVPVSGANTPLPLWHEEDDDLNADDLASVIAIIADPDKVASTPLTKVNQPAVASDAPTSPVMPIVPHQLSVETTAACNTTFTQPSPPQQVVPVATSANSLLGTAALPGAAVPSFYTDPAPEQQPSPVPPSAWATPTVAAAAAVATQTPSTTPQRQAAAVQALTNPSGTDSMTELDVYNELIVAVSDEEQQPPQLEPQTQFDPQAAAMNATNSLIAQRPTALPLPLQARHSLPLPVTEASSAFSHYQQRQPGPQAAALAGGGNNLTSSPHSSATPCSAAMRQSRKRSSTEPAAVPRELVPVRRSSRPRKTRFDLQPDDWAMGSDVDEDGESDAFEHGHDTGRVRSAGRPRHHRRHNHGGGGEYGDDDDEDSDFVASDVDVASSGSSEEYRPQRSRGRPRQQGSRTTTSQATKRRRRGGVIDTESEAGSHYDDTGFDSAGSGADAGVTHRRAARRLPTNERPLARVVGPAKRRKRACDMTLAELEHARALGRKHARSSRRLQKQRYERMLHDSARLARRNEKLSAEAAGLKRRRRQLQEMLTSLGILPTT